VSSSILVKGGTIRITLSMRTPVEVGAYLRGRYRVTNISKQPRKIYLSDASPRPDRMVAG